VIAAARKIIRSCSDLTKNGVVLFDNDGDKKSSRCFSLINIDVIQDLMKIMGKLVCKWA
jgi:hypothetical protein